MTNRPRSAFLPTLLISLTIFSSSASGQDLGSTSGLFSKPVKKIRSEPAESKKTSKTASSVSANRAPRKKSTAESRSGARSGPRPNVRIRDEFAAGAEDFEALTIKVGVPSSGKFGESFEQAIEEGNQARNVRDYEKAESAYKRAGSIIPSDSRWVYGLGNLYSDQQRWDEAERAYRHAIKIDPGSPYPYVALSFVLVQPIAGADLPERYAEAEKAARKALSLDPENPFSHDQLGVALENRGIISDETQAAYREALRLEPEFALAYAHLGRLLRKNGRNAEAAEADSAAVRLAEDFPTMILVADVFQSQQRYAESEKLLQKALNIDPRNPTGLFLMGRALTALGRFPEAETVLLASVSVSPKSSVAYLLLGSLYQRTGKFIEAEKVLARASALISQREKVLLSREFESLGDAYLKTGRAADAKRVYNRAAAVAPAGAALKAKIAEIAGN